MSGRGRPTFLRANNNTPSRTSPIINNNANNNNSNNNNCDIESNTTNSGSPGLSAFEKLEIEQQKDKEKILKALKDHYESSDSDEDEKIVISNVTKKNRSYSPVIAEKIISNLETPCLICLQKVKVKDSIWQCETCYCLVHLECSQLWARSSLNDIDAEILCWLCPQCRSPYPKAFIPTEYFCFCKKQIDPIYDKWMAPHSCGQICGKQLKPECGHTCTTLCHPGRCSPCAQTVKARCYCGSTETIRRCNERGHSCNRPCNRLLQCNIHRCARLCHEGECGVCPSVSEQICQCGEVKKLVECQNTIFQCNKKCSKWLSCGRHQCLRVCHPPGECGGCELEGDRKCYCGKSTYSNLTCDMPTPSCGDSCDKLLACGIHRCPSRCHPGDCPSCKMRAEKLCRCKSAKKVIICDQSFTCERRCNKMRNCTKHACKRKCCIECPPCEEICNNKLNCRTHRCEAPCHRGVCFPCPKIVTITCPCKRTVISVPCGAERNTPAPECSLQCNIPPFCHHPERQPHLCHQGECPPCTLECGVEQPTCYHSCPLPCHDPKPIIQYTARKRKPIPPKPVLLNEVVCPPCAKIVQRQCYGFHHSVQVKCSTPRLFSCALKCGNPLQCGNHYCDLPCHVITHPRFPPPQGDGNHDHRFLVIDKNETLPKTGTFEKVEVLMHTSSGIVTLVGKRNIRDIIDHFSKSGKAIDTCVTCPLPCQKPRRPACKHPCPRPCHPGECEPCSVKINKYCHCPLNEKTVLLCHQTHISKEEMDKRISCGNECTKKMPCGHICGLICHSGACNSPMNCNKHVPITCPCKRLKKKVICCEREKEKMMCDDECERQISLRKASPPVVASLVSSSEDNNNNPSSGGRRRPKKRDTEPSDAPKKKKKPLFSQLASYFEVSPELWKRLLVYLSPLLLILFIVFLSMLNELNNKR